MVLVVAWPGPKEPGAPVHAGSAVVEPAPPPVRIVPELPPRFRCRRFRSGRRRRFRSGQRRWRRRFPFRWRPRFPRRWRPRFPRRWRRRRPCRWRRRCPRRWRRRRRAAGAAVVPLAPPSPCRWRRRVARAAGAAASCAAGESLTALFPSQAKPTTVHAATRRRPLSRVMCPVKQSTFHANRVEFAGARAAAPRRPRQKCPGPAVQRLAP